MSAAAKRALVLALGVALLAVLALVAARVERGRAEGAPRVSPGENEPATAVVDAPARPQGERSSLHAIAGSAGAPVASASAEEELGGPAPDRHARLLAVTGRVVDENGAGIASAEVLSCLPSHGGAVRELLARSVADGSFVGEFRIGRAWLEFLVLAEGRTRAVVPVHTEVGGSIHLGTIALAPGGDVRGVVEDESGTPVGRAWVVAYPVEAFPLDQESARTDGIAHTEQGPAEHTDDQGRFHLRGVGIGTRFVSAQRAGLGWCEPFELVAGSTAEVRIVLPMPEPAIDRIAGVVRDPEGRPLEGIGVTFSGRSDGEWARSDEDGTFSIDASWLHEDGGRARVFANDPELRFGPAVSEGIAPGTHGLELTLTPPSWIRLELRDPGGEPIPWGHVRAGVGPHWYAPVPELDLGRSGKARIPKPVQTLALEAEAPGFRKGTFGPYEPPAIPDALVLVLEPGQALRGRVSFEGRPVAGATLDLCHTNEPGKWSESISVAPLEHPFSIHGRIELEGSDGTTDAQGAFVLTIPDDGWYGLRVEAAGFPTLVHGPFELSTAGQDGLEVELERAGAQEGRVLLAAGAEPLGRMVGVSDGRGYARTTAAGADGSYRFDDLAPGHYQVRSCTPPVGARQVLWRRQTTRDDAIEWDCAVVAGATTRFELDLTQEETCVLAGSFGLGDEDPRKWSAELREPDRDVVLARTRIDRDGRFRLALSTPGVYLLHIAHVTRAFTEEVRLARGELAWELRLEAGLLRVGIDESRGARRSGALVFVQEPAGAPRFQVSFWLETLDGEDFRVSVPAGLGRLEIRGKRDAPRTKLPELEIRSGAETAFTLPADAF